MNEKKEYFTKSNWTNCLKKQLQGFNLNLTEIEMYVSLYEYAKGGSLFLPDIIFPKVGGCFNNYAPIYIKKILNVMRTAGLIKKSRKQDSDLGHNHPVRFIEFNVHPRKKVDWS